MPRLVPASHVLPFYKLALRLSLCDTAGKILSEKGWVRERVVWEVAVLFNNIYSRPDKTGNTFILAWSSTFCSKNLI